MPTIPIDQVFNQYVDRPLEYFITINAIMQSVLTNLGITWMKDSKLDIRVTFDFDTVTHKIVLIFGNIDLVTLAVVTGTRIGDVDLYQAIRQLINRCGDTKSKYLVDDKIAYDNLSDLESEIVDKVKDSTATNYEQKLYEQLQTAKSNGHLHCMSSDKKCYDRVIFDFTTEKLDDFKLHELKYPELLTSDKKYLEDYTDKTVKDALIAYTGNDFSIINGALLMEHYYNIKPGKNAGYYISKMDKFFDTLGANRKPTIFNEAITLFRLGRFTTLSKNSESINLYKVKFGYEFPLVIFTSTTYTNKNSNLKTYYQDSHFKGVVFVISAHTNKGIISLQSISVLPNEKELLLDRRGRLKVTKVSWDYVAGDCKNNIRLYEKMIIYCDYIPPDYVSSEINQPTVQINLEKKTIGGNVDLNVIIDTKEERVNNNPKINEYFGQVIDNFPWIYSNSIEHCVLTMKYLSYLVLDKPPGKIFVPTYKVQTPSGIAYISVNVAKQIIPHMYAPLIAGLRMEILEPQTKLLQSSQNIAIPVVIGAGIEHIFNLCTIIIIFLLIIVIVYETYKVTTSFINSQKWSDKKASICNMLEYDNNVYKKI